MQGLGLSCYATAAKPISDAEQRYVAATWGGYQKNSSLLYRVASLVMASHKAAPASRFPDFHHGKNDRDEDLHSLTFASCKEETLNP